MVRIVTTTLSLVLVGAVSLAPQAAAASVASVGTRGVNAHPGSVGDSGGGSVVEANLDAAGVTKVATFIVDGDDAHISRSAPATASAHGYWIKVTTKATRAVVTIWLQVKVGSKWKTVGSQKKTVKSGGGKGRRATARMTCAAGPIAKRPVYRSVIDVDLVGYVDDPRRAVTDPQALKCLPSR